MTSIKNYQPQFIIDEPINVKETGDKKLEKKFSPYKVTCAPKPTQCKLQCPCKETTKRITCIKDAGIQSIGNELLGKESKRNGGTFIEDKPKKGKETESDQLSDKIVPYTAPRAPKPPPCKLSCREKKSTEKVTPKKEIRPQQLLDVDGELSLFATAPPQRKEKTESTGNYEPKMTLRKSSAECSDAATVNQEPTEQTEVFEDTVSELPLVNLGSTSRSIKLVEDNILVGQSDGQSVMSKKITRDICKAACSTKSESTIEEKVKEEQNVPFEDGAQIDEELIPRSAKIAYEIKEKQNGKHPGVENKFSGDACHAASGGTVDLTPCKCPKKSQPVINVDLVPRSAIIIEIPAEPIEKTSFKKNALSPNRQPSDTAPDNKKSSFQQTPADQTIESKSFSQQIRPELKEVEEQVSSHFQCRSDDAEKLFDDEIDEPLLSLTLQGQPKQNFKNERTRPSENEPENDEYIESIRNKQASGKQLNAKEKILLLLSDREKEEAQRDCKRLCCPCKFNEHDVTKSHPSVPRKGGSLEKGNAPSELDLPRETLAPTQGHESIQAVASTIQSTSQTLERNIKSGLTTVDSPTDGYVQSLPAIPVTCPDIDSVLLQPNMHAPIKGKKSEPSGDEINEYKGPYTSTIQPTLNFKSEEEKDNVDATDTSTAGASFPGLPDMNTQSIDKMRDTYSSVAKSSRVSSISCKPIEPIISCVCEENQDFVDAVRRGDSEPDPCTVECRAPCTTEITESTSEPKFMNKTSPEAGANFKLNFPEVPDPGAQTDNKERDTYPYVGKPSDVSRINREPIEPLTSCICADDQDFVNAVKLGNIDVDCIDQCNYPCAKINDQTVESKATDGYRETRDFVDPNDIYSAGASPTAETNVPVLSKLSYGSRTSGKTIETIISCVCEEDFTEAVRREEPIPDSCTVECKSPCATEITEETTKPKITDISQKTDVAYPFNVAAPATTSATVGPSTPYIADTRTANQTIRPLDDKEKVCDIDPCVIDCEASCAIGISEETIKPIYVPLDTAGQIFSEIPEEEVFSRQSHSENTKAGPSVPSIPETQSLGVMFGAPVTATVTAGPSVPGICDTKCTGVMPGGASFAELLVKEHTKAGPSVPSIPYTKNKGVMLTAADTTSVRAGSSVPGIPDTKSMEIIPGETMRPTDTGGVMLTATTSVTAGPSVPGIPGARSMGVMFGAADTASVTAGPSVPGICDTKCTGVMSVAAYSTSVTAGPSVPGIPDTRSTGIMPEETLRPTTTSVTAGPSVPGIPGARNMGVMFGAADTASVTAGPSVPGICDTKCTGVVSVAAYSASVTAGPSVPGIPDTRSTGIMPGEESCLTPTDRENAEAGPSVPGIPDARSMGVMFKAGDTANVTAGPSVPGICDTRCTGVTPEMPPDKIMVDRGASAPRIYETAGTSIPTRVSLCLSAVGLPEDDVVQTTPEPCKGVCSVNVSSHAWFHCGCTCAPRYIRTDATTSTTASKHTLNHCTAICAVHGRRKDGKSSSGQDAASYTHDVKSTQEQNIASAVANRQLVQYNARVYSSLSKYHLQFDYKPFVPWDITSKDFVEKLKEKAALAARSGFFVLFPHHDYLHRTIIPKGYFAGDSSLEDYFLTKNATPRSLPDSDLLTFSPRDTISLSDSSDELGDSKNERLILTYQVSYADSDASTDGLIDKSVQLTPSTIPSTRLSRVLSGDSTSLNPVNACAYTSSINISDVRSSQSLHYKLSTLKLESANWKLEDVVTSPSENNIREVIDRSTYVNEEIDFDSAENPEISQSGDNTQNGESNVSKASAVKLWEVQHVDVATGMSLEEIAITDLKMLVVDATEVSNNEAYDEKSAASSKVPESEVLDENIETFKPQYVDQIIQTSEKESSDEEKGKTDLNTSETEAVVHTDKEMQVSLIEDGIMLDRKNTIDKLTQSEVKNDDNTVHEEQIPLLDEPDRKEIADAFTYTCKKVFKRRQQETQFSDTEETESDATQTSKDDVILSVPKKPVGVANMATYTCKKMLKNKKSVAAEESPATDKEEVFEDAVEQQNTTMAVETSKPKIRPKHSMHELYKKQGKGVYFNGKIKLKTSNGAVEEISRLKLLEEPASSRERRNFRKSDVAKNIENVKTAATSRCKTATGTCRAHKDQDGQNCTRCNNNANNVFSYHCLTSNKRSDLMANSFRQKQLAKQQSGDKQTRRDEKSSKVTDRKPVARPAEDFTPLFSCQYQNRKPRSWSTERKELKKHPFHSKYSNGQSDQVTSEKGAIKLGLNGQEDSSRGGGGAKEVKHKKEETHRHGGKKEEDRKGESSKRYKINETTKKDGGGEKVGCRSKSTNREVESRILRGIPEDSREDLPSLLIRKDTEIIALRNALATKESYCTEQRKFAAAAIEQLDHIKTVIEERDDLRKKLESSQEELEELKKQISSNKLPTVFTPTYENVGTAPCHLPLVEESTATDDEIMQLEKDIQHIRTNNSTPEIETKVIRRELDVLKKFCTKLSMIQQENYQLKAQISEYESTFSKLGYFDHSQTQIDELKHRIRTVTDALRERDTLKIKVEKLEKQLLDYKCLPEDVDVFRQRSLLLDEIIKDRDRLSRRVEQLRGLDEEMTSLRKKVSRVDELEDNLMRMAREKMLIEEEADHLRNKCSAVEIESYNKQAEGDTLRSKLVCMEHEVESLKCLCEDKERLRAERDHLKHDLDELIRMQGDFDQVKKHVKCLEVLKAERDMFKAKYENLIGLECECDILRTQVERAKTIEQERDALENQVEDMEMCITEQESEIRRLVCHIDLLAKGRDEEQEKFKNILIQMRAEVDKKDILIQNAEEKLCLVQSELKDSIEGLSSETIKLKNKNENLECLIVDLETEHNQLKDRNEHLEMRNRQLETQQEEIGEIQENNQELLQHLLQFKQSNEILATRIEVLAEENEFLIKRLEEKESSLKTLMSVLQDHEPILDEFEKQISLKDSAKDTETETDPVYVVATEMNTTKRGSRRLREKVTKPNTVTVDRALKELLTRSKDAVKRIYTELHKQCKEWYSLQSKVNQIKDSRKLRDIKHHEDYIVNYCISTGVNTNITKYYHQTRKQCQAVQATSSAAEVSISTDEVESSSFVSENKSLTAYTRQHMSRLRTEVGTTTDDLNQIVPATTTNPYRTRKMVSRRITLSAEELRKNERTQLPERTVYPTRRRAKSGGTQFDDGDISKSECKRQAGNFDLSSWDCKQKVFTQMRQSSRSVQNLDSTISVSTVEQISIARIKSTKSCICNLQAPKYVDAIIQDTSEVPPASKVCFSNAECQGTVKTVCTGMKTENLVRDAGTGRGDVSTKEEEVEAFETARSSPCKHCKNLEEQLEILKNDFVSYQLEMCQREQELSIRSTACTHCKYLEEHIDILRNELAALTEGAVQPAVLQQCESLESQIDILKDELESLDRELEPEIWRQCESLENVIKSLKSELASSNKPVQHTICKHCKNLEEQIGILKRTASDQPIKQTVCRHCETLEDQLATLKKELVVLDQPLQIPVCAHCNQLEKQHEKLKQELISLNKSMKSTDCLKCKDLEQQLNVFKEQRVEWYEHTPIVDCVNCKEFKKQVESLKRQLDTFNRPTQSNVCMHCKDLEKQLEMFKMERKVPCKETQTTLCGNCEHLQDQVKSLNTQLKALNQQTRPTACMRCKDLEKQLEMFKMERKVPCKETQTTICENCKNLEDQLKSLKVELKASNQPKQSIACAHCKELEEQLAVFRSKRNVSVASKETQHTVCGNRKDLETQMESVKKQLNTSNQTEVRADVSTISETTQTSQSVCKDCLYLQERLELLERDRKLRLCQKTQTGKSKCNECQYLADRIEALEQDLIKANETVYELRDKSLTTERISAENEALRRHSDEVQEVAKDQIEDLIEHLKKVQTRGTILEDENEKLKKVNDDLTLEKNEKSKLIEELNQRNADLIKDIADLERRAADTRELDELKRELDRAVKEKDDIEKILAKDIVCASKKNTEQESEISTLSSKNKNLEIEVARLKLFQQESKTLTDKLANVNCKLACSETLVKNLQEKLAHSSDENKTLQEELERVRLELKELEEISDNDELDFIKKQNESLMRKIDNQALDLNRLLEKIKHPPVEISGPTRAELHEKGVLKSIIEDLESQIKSVGRGVNIPTQPTSDLQDTLGELTKRLDETETRANNAEAMVSTLKLSDPTAMLNNELSNCMAKLMDLEAENKQLNKAAIQHRDDIEQLERELEEVTRELKLYADDNNRLKDALNQQNAENEKRTATGDASSKSEVEKLEEQIKMLQAEKVALAAKATENEFGYEKLDKMQHEMANLKRELVKTENEAEKLRKELENTLSNRKADGDKIDLLENEKVKHLTTIQNLENEISKLKMELDSILNSAKDSTTGVSELHDEITRLKLKVDRLEGDNTKLKKELDNALASYLDLNQKLAQKSKENDNLIKEKIASADQISKIKSQFSKAFTDATNKELDELKNKLAELEAQNVSLKEAAEGSEKVNELQEVISLLRQQIASLENENCRLRKELEKAKDELKTTQIKVKEKPSTLPDPSSRLEADNTRLKRELNELLDKAAKASVEVLDCQESIKKLKQKISLLQIENIKLKKEINDILDGSKSTATETIKLKDNESYLKQRLAQLESENLKLKNDFDSMSLTHKHCSYQMEELKNAVDQFERENNNLKENLEVALKNLDSTEVSAIWKQRALQSEEALNKVKKEFECALSDHKKCPITIMHLEEESIRMKRKLVEQESEISNLNKHLDGALGDFQKHFTEIEKQRTDDHKTNELLSKLQTDNDRLSQNVMYLSTELGDVKLALSKSNEKAASLKQKGAELEDENVKLKNTLDVTMRETDNLQKTINQLKNDNVKYKEKIAQLEAENAKLKKEFDNFAVNVKKEQLASTDDSKWREKLQQLENENRKLKSEINNVLDSAKLSAEAKEYEMQLKHQLAKLEHEANKLKSDLEKALNDTEVGSNLIALLKEEKGKLKQKISALESEVSSLKNELNTALEQAKEGATSMSEVQDSDAKLKQKVAQLENDNDKLRNSLDQALRDAQSAISTTEDLGAENAKQKQLSAQLEGEIDKLRRRLSSAESRRPSADNEKADLKKKVIQLQQENSKLKLSLNDVYEEAKATAETNSNYVDENVNLKRKLLTMQKELMALQSDFNKSEMENNDLTVKIKEYEATFKRQLAKLENANADLKQTVHATGGDARVVRKATEENTLLRENLAQSENDLRKIRSNFDDVVNETKRKTNEIQKLKDELAASKQKLADLEKCNARLKAELDSIQLENSKVNKDQGDKLAAVKLQFDKEMKNLLKKNEDSIAKLQKSQQEITDELKRKCDADMKNLKDALTKSKKDLEEVTNERDKVKKMLEEQRKKSLDIKDKVEQVEDVINRERKKSKQEKQKTKSLTERVEELVKQLKDVESKVEHLKRKNEELEVENDEFIEKVMKLEKEKEGLEKSASILRETFEKELLKNEDLQKDIVVLKKMLTGKGEKALTVETFNIASLDGQSPEIFAVTTPLSEKELKFFGRKPCTSNKFNLQSILSKVAVDGLSSLCIEELQLLHNKLCDATADQLSKLGQSTGVLRPNENDRLGLLKRIATLEGDLLKKQKHAQQKVIAMQYAVKLEKERLQDLKRSLEDEKKKNCELLSQIDSHSKVVSNIRDERDSIQRQKSYHEQKLEQYIVTIEEERARTRNLEDELDKEKTNVLHLKSLLEAERNRAKLNKRKDTEALEKMRITLEKTVNSEMVLKMKLQDKSKPRSQSPCTPVKDTNVPTKNKTPYNTGSSSECRSLKSYSGRRLTSGFSRNQLSSNRLD